MKKKLKIGLVGDYDTGILAHTCIPNALAISSKSMGLALEIHWLSTDKIEGLNPSEKKSFNAFWCVPGSPYKDRAAALRIIRFARESSIPYLGTCGGYQHAILEFAINELGLTKACLEEEDPSGEMLLISALPCRLVDEERKITIEEDTHLGRIMGTSVIAEEYRCGFGMNKKYSHHFNEAVLKFVAFNDEGIPQAIELSDHPFFIGTAFQPERSSQKGEDHPLIRAFLQAAISI